MIKSSKGSQEMQENGERGEQQSVQKRNAIQPELKIPRDQVILDYDNEAHREQIKNVLYRHFDEGRTDKANLMRIVSSPGANPRIVNLSEHLIGSHRGMHTRWCKKEEKTGIQMIEGKPGRKKHELETFKQDVEGEISEVRDKVESMEDLLKKIDKSLEAEPPKPEEPETPPPQIIPKELESLSQRVSKRQEEAKAMKNRVELMNKKAEVMEKLAEKKKALDEAEQRIRDAQNTIDGKVEEEPKRSKLDEELCEFLTEVHEVVPESFDNILADTKRAFQIRIKEMLEETG